MADLKEQVGKRLKECRLSMGLTQAQVADKLGVAQPVYLRFEKGKFECNYEQLVKLSTIFDTSIDYLLGKIDY